MSDHVVVQGEVAWFLNPVRHAFFVGYLVSFVLIAPDHTEYWAAARISLVIGGLSALGSALFCLMIILLARSEGEPEDMEEL